MTSILRTGRLILAIHLIARSAGTLYAATGTAPPPSGIINGIKSAYPQLPLYFEANRGQADAPVKFLARGPGYRLYLTFSEATLVFQQDTVRLHLIGSNPHPLIEGRDSLPGKSNYVIGNNSKKWITGVTQYSKVAYKQVYPGIDMIYEGEGQQLEYSFIVAPGVDAGLIRMNFKGADHLRLDPEGNLILSFKAGSEATFKAPSLYQHVGNERVAVRGRFVLVGEKLVRFEVGDYVHSKELVIDPSLTYSTYLGGTVDDRAYAIAVDASGNVYVTGETTSNLFPGTAGQFQSANGGGASDVFVTKMNAAGTAILWSTYIGGGGDEQGNGIAVDGSGNVYITGSMTVGGAAFPTTLGAYGGLGGINAFVTAINPTGTALIYSRILGGAGVDHGNGIAVSASGIAYITGDTTSTNPDLPSTVGAFQAANGGAVDAFVASFDAAGGIRYFSYLGGTTADEGEAIAIDSLGDAYVTGQTSNGTFPITPLAPPASAAFKTTITGATDAFIAKLNPSGTSLLYSTFVGGSGDDEGTAIVLDSSNNVYITGFTYSADFPKIGFTSVGQTVIGTAPDAFVFKLHIGNGGGSNDGVYSTYLGASTDDRGLGIAVDGFGDAYVTGHTTSGDFPTVNPLPGQSTLGATGKAFVTEIGPTGATKVFSTYLGGITDQAGQGIALDSSNNIYVAGWTNSTDFPMAVPIQGANAGSFDAFVSKISAPTPPPIPPTALTGTALGVSSISWTWNAVTGASAYNIYQATSTTTLIVSTPTTNFLETGLSSNTAYGRVVTSIVNGLESSLSPSATTYTLAATPGTPIFSNVFSTSFTVTWATNNPTGTRFEVSRSTTNDNFATAVSTPIAFTDSFTLGTTNFSSLQPGTTYYLRVRAENGAVPGAGIPTAFDATASTVTLPTPSPTSLAGSALGVSSISWTWNAVSAASSYNIYQATSPTTLVISTPTPGYVETGLSSNTAYGRVVTAVLNNVESALSPSATTYTLAATPGTPVFTNVFYTSFTVTWAANNPTGTRFEVSRSTTNDNFATSVSTPIAFTDSFIVGTTNFSGLQPGTTYYLRVRAENGAVPGAGIPTAFDATASTVTLPTPSPASLAGSALGVSSISWTWNSVTGASSYNFYNAADNSLLQTNVTPYAEISLSTNIAYGRRVTAVVNGVESALSPDATAYTLAAVPGQPVFSTVVYTSFTVTWSTNTNPAGTRYEVSQSTDNFVANFSTPVPFGSFTNNTTTFLNLTPATTHYIRVRAENGDLIATTFSTVNSTRTLDVPSPTGLAGSALGVSSITWSWNSVTGASSYNFYNAADNSLLQINVASPYAEINLSTNVVYGRRVSVVVNNVESALSPSATTYTLAWPPGTPVFTNVFSTSFTVTWATNNPAGTHFEVSRSTTNDNFATGVSTPIAFTDSFTLGTADFSGLIPGDTYYLRIRAENGSVAGAGIVTAFSATGSTVTLTSLLPTGLTGTALAAATINWTWNAALGASAYHIYQATSTTTLVNSTPSTNFIETGLSTNTAYGRVVTAIINGAESGLSAGATTYTLAAVPGPAVPSNIAYSSFTITWPDNGNPGYTRYEVSLSTDNFTANFSTPAAFGALTAASANLVNLNPGTTYYVRVRAENGAVAGAGIVTAFSVVSSTVTWSTVSLPSPPPPPDAFSLTPITGPDAGGTQVVITGNGFMGATSVTFNGQNALSFTVDSDTQITTRSPAQAAGPAIHVDVSRLSGSAFAGNYTYFLTITPSRSGSGSYIFPSPANGPTANIVYTMAESGTVEIRVYNEVGDLVIKVEDTKPAGVQMSLIHTDRLAPGVYFYILNSNYNSGNSDEHKLKKFVVKH